MTAQSNGTKRIVNVGCSLVLVLMVVAIAASAWTTGGLWMPYPSSNQVTLKSSPFSDIVQMFERVGLGDEGTVTHFPNGTSCTKLSGPSVVDFGDGDVLYFDKLTCHGVTGYVNVKWVSPY